MQQQPTILKHLSLTTTATQNSINVDQSNAVVAATSHREFALNENLLSAIEQQLPLEIFLQTPPLTGDGLSSSNNSTNSLCSTILSEGGDLTGSSAAGTVVAVEDSSTSELAGDNNERPLVLVIITDYNVQQ